MLEHLVLHYETRESLMLRGILPADSSLTSATSAIPAPAPGAGFTFPAPPEPGATPTLLAPAPAGATSAMLASAPGATPTCPAAAPSVKLVILDLTQEPDQVGSPVICSVLADPGT